MLPEVFGCFGVNVGAGQADIVEDVIIHLCQQATLARAALPKPGFLVYFNREAFDAFNCRESQGGNVQIFDQVEMFRFSRTHGVARVKMLSGFFRQRCKLMTGIIGSDWNSNRFSLFEIQP